MSSIAAPGPPPNEDGMLLLEASFARVPHEELRRHLRTQQRHVERDLAFCTATIDALSKSAKGSAAKGLVAGTASQAASIPGSHSASALPSSSSSSVPSAAESGGPSPGDVSRDGGSTSFLADVSFSSEAASILEVGESSFSRAEEADDGASRKRSDLDKSLDLMIGRVNGLKKRITNVHDLAGPALTRLDARTRHLSQLQSMTSITSPSFDEWCRTRLNRMLVDWLLRKGHLQSAQMLAESRGIEDYTELSLFAEISRIEASMIGTADEDGRLVGRSCAPTLAWCSENKAALRKIKSTLEFDLRLQEFVEMARSRSPESMEEALLYCRRYLLPYLSASTKASDAETASKSDEKEDAEEAEQAQALRKEVSRAMGLLACGPTSPTYAALYSPARWDKLRETFRKAALQIHSLPRQSILHIALSAGLSSLKLPACYADEHSSSTSVPHLGGPAFGDDINKILAASGVSSASISAPTFPPAAGMGGEEAAPSVVVSAPMASSSSTFAGTAAHVGHSHGHGEDATPLGRSSKNNNCPVCDTEGLGVLAKEVPWSHHANSTLVCAISGKMMNENDPPMALPNGRVYSHGALQELAMASHDGETIVCPRTGDSFSIKTLRKVFIS